MSNCKNFKYKYNIFNIDKLTTISTKTDSKLSCVLLLIKTGSINESRNQAGIAHLLEHLVFKGTQQFKADNELTNYLDKNGFIFNAFTGHEETGYYIIGSNIEKILETLAEMYYNPTFLDKYIETEKKVVMNELKEENYNYDLILEIGVLDYFFPNNPGIAKTGGTIDSVKKITRNQVLQFYKEYYYPANTMLLISSCDDITKQTVQKYFNSSKYPLENIYPKIKEKKNDIPFIKIDSPSFNSPSINLTSRDVDQINIYFGIKTIGRKKGKKLLIMMDLLLIILLRGFSSRLVKKLRVDEGLVYSIQNSNYNFSNNGCTIIKTSSLSKIDHLYKILNTIHQEVSAIATNITSDELEIAKKIYLSTFNSDNEDNLSLLLEMGIQHNFYHKIYLNDLDNIIEKTTIKDLMKLAKEMFKPNHYYINILCNTEIKKQFDKKRITFL